VFLGVSDVYLLVDVRHSRESVLPSVPQAISLSSACVGRGATIRIVFSYRATGTYTGYYRLVGVQAYNEIEGSPKAGVLPRAPTRIEGETMK
jgi:hypothetical protein